MSVFLFQHWQIPPSLLGNILYCDGPQWGRLAHASVALFQLYAKSSQSLLTGSSKSIFSTKLSLHPEKVAPHRGFLQLASRELLVFPVRAFFSVCRAQCSLCAPSFWKGKGSPHVSTPFGRKNNFQMASYFELEAETDTCDTYYHGSPEVLLLYYLIPVMWWHTD